MSCNAPILVALTVATIATAATGQTPAQQIVSDLTGLCDRVLAEPQDAIKRVTQDETFYAENADQSEITNSYYWEDQGNHSQSFRRNSLDGGVMLHCAIWHAYWQGDHPYGDLPEVVDQAAQSILGPSSHRSGGQLKDMSLRAERYVWSDGQFPPRGWIQLSLHHDSVNLYLNLAVPDDE